MRSALPLTSTVLVSAWTLGLGCGLPLGGDATDGEEAEVPEFVHHGKNEAALTRAVSCDQVLDEIRANVSARLVERAEQLRRPPQVYYGEPGVIVDGDGLWGEVKPPPIEVPASDDAASPNAPAQGPVLEESAAVEPGFSGTTVQVLDVDEADIVKADGDFLYLLHGNALLQLRAWPAEETELLATTIIEGDPVEMFVHEGKALVYSNVYRDLAQLDPYASTDYYYSPYSNSYTKLTLVDVSGDEPSVLRESYLEGYYASARRHDDVARTIIQNWSKTPALDGVYIEYFTPFGEPYRQQDIDAQVDAWLERSLWAVGETEIGDWLPRQFTVIDGVPVEEEPNCGDYYQPPDADISQSGITSIVSLDLEQDDGQSALQSVTVLARAERVYANDDVVLLSQTDYGSFENNYSETTTLHRFDLQGASTEYSASGALPGYVHNQFSLDEREGWIRVSTTQNVWNGDTGAQLGPKNRIFTLATNDGWLDVAGQTEVFGQGEQIYATRFMGDLGYVVTFRQVDPLFVVDLAVPRRPTVVGELHIPGFSNFLYPLDDGHLLAIGRDATPEGFAQGIALQIFDVTDPSAPTLAHKYVYEGDGYSSAEADHRAISFHPELDRISFPLQNWQTGASSLEVFDVSTVTGFTRLGGILPPSNQDITAEECALMLGYTEADLVWLRAEFEAFPEYEESFASQCRFQEQMRRGVFRDDHVYGISTLGVYAHTASALDAPPVGAAELPPAYYGYPYYGVSMPTADVGAGGGTFVGQAGSAMMPGPSGEGGSAMAAGSGGASGD